MLSLSGGQHLLDKHRGILFCMSFSFVNVYLVRRAYDIGNILFVLECGRIGLKSFLCCLIGDFGRCHKFSEANPEHNNLFIDCQNIPNPNVFSGELTLS